MELLKVLNKKGEFTGEILDRDIVHELGLWHGEIAVWVFNKQGEVLVQRRSTNKKIHPNKLSICAGHIESINDSVTTAKIELKEELNITKKLKDIYYLLTEKIITKVNKKFINRIFSDVYYTLENKNTANIKIQKEELSEVFWINYLDLKKRILNKDDEISITYTHKKFKLLDQIYSKITH